MKKTFFYLFLTTILSALLVACNDKDTSKVAVVFSAKNGSATKSATAPMKVKSALSADVKTFKINIAEIEFEFDDDDPMYNENDPLYDDDLELKGPFTVDLMLNGREQVKTILDGVKLPLAAYDEIEFEFDKVEKRDHPMYKYSIIAEGFINGVPFKYYTDEEFDMEIEFPNRLIVDGVQKPIVNVEFDIAMLFDPALGGVDLTRAVDTNKDGQIIITNIDSDNTQFDYNKTVAEQIKNRLKYIIKSYEGDDDDD